MKSKKCNLFIKVITLPFLFLLIFSTTPNILFAAYYPLEIINIRQAESGSPAISPANRIFKAYPGIEYNIRVAAIGGAYPLTYTLSNAPIGMHINSFTGEISWPNPQIDANNITVTVTDRESNSVNAEWSIGVTTSGFIFVDSTYSGTKDGSVSHPYNTIEEILNLGSSYKDYIIYFRGGNYILPAYNGAVTEWEKTRGCFLGYDGGRPNKWIGYPGESVTINMSGHRLEMSASRNNDAYFDNIKFTNMVGYGMISSCGVDYFTVRRCDFSGCEAPLSVNGNWGIIYHNRDGGTGYYKVFQDSKFHDYRGVAGIGSLYASSKVLIEDCEFYNQFQGISDIKTAIAPKTNISYLFIRKNKFYKIHYGFCIGHATNSALIDSNDIEISYNLFDAPIAHNAFNTHNSTGTLHYYRNTTMGQILFQNSGPFTVEKCVIQNNSGGIGLPGISFTEIDNLKGTSNIVDTSGSLTTEYRSYLGTHGWQVIFDNSAPASPTGITVKVE